MIEKMKFVNIMGPINDIERVKDVYLKNCEIQLEDAVAELGDTKVISSFYVVNTYVEHLRKAEHFADLIGVTIADETHLSKEEAISIVDKIDVLLKEQETKIADLTADKRDIEESIAKIAPYTELDFPIEKMFNFNFIKYRFGRIPVSSYKQFEAYLSDHEAILFEKASADRDYVYCLYFVPDSLSEKFDAIFSSLHFERVVVPEELEGTLADAHRKLKQKISDIDGQIHDLEVEQREKLQKYSEDLPYAYKKIQELSDHLDMQKFAAKTKEDFYIMVGWMSEKDAIKFQKRTESDDKVVVIIEDNSKEIKTHPPTKLKNIALFRPFEFLIRLYGLPRYDEIDPTLFFGLSYSLLFGFMFGDLGQGLTLSIVGFMLYRFRKIELGAVVAVIGLFSAFFGLMYGSVFGYEHIIHPIWVNPMENMATVLVTTVVFGICLNISAMLIHIVNAAKRKQLGDVLFDTNGVSGLVFYVAALTASLCAYTGYYTITAAIAAIFIGIPLILMAFKEPLTSLLNGRKELLSEKTSDFLMSLFFEMFEILLSYVTNTISFVRVGAFALCHVGMMTVILALAGAEGHSLGNPVVMIIGNIFVMCMEGLVVGIQALRLQYYEMFSRYFTGGGREFKSLKY